MTPTEPLPLHHSWPIWMAERFDLGRVADAGEPIVPQPLAGAATVMGRWYYDLEAGRMDWSPELCRLFGFDRIGIAPTRDDVLPLYRESSRVAMERLRHHAIRYCRGFTIDIAVRSVVGDAMWLRLIAAPIARERRVVRLDGWKADVTHLYA